LSCADLPVSLADQAVDLLGLALNSLNREEVLTRIN